MSKRSMNPKTRVTVSTYRDDRLYRRVAQAVEELLAEGNVVAPVDVLVHMGLLKPKHLEDWRRGRVPYLEKVIDCNLHRLSKLLRILRFCAHDMNLVPSATAYMRWGKGPKQRLRFTKTGDPRVEEAYARHFLWPGKGPFHSPVARNEKPRDTDPDREVQGSPAKEYRTWATARKRRAERDEKPARWQGYRSVKHLNRSNASIESSPRSSRRWRCVF